jgi:short-subunit dehydrogenase
VKAIIIGATSGIGRELAIILAQQSYTLGLTGRRQPLLAELRQTLPTQVFTQPMDVADHQQAMDLLEQLITQLGGVDLVVISAGTGFENPELNWPQELATIEVNVTGFAAMANVAFRHFVAAGSGHLVGISSIAALRGSRQAPAYSASKAFVSNYLEGLRCRAAKARLPITVTDIQPGFVDTRMAQGDGLFWVASPQEAACQIHQAIQRRAPHAYITRRWRLVAWLLRLLPNFLLAKF